MQIISASDGTVGTVGSLAYQINGEDVASHAQVEVETDQDTFFGETAAGCEDEGTEETVEI